MSSSPWTSKPNPFLSPTAANRTATATGTPSKNVWGSILTSPPAPPAKPNPATSTSPGAAPAAAAPIPLDPKIQDALTHLPTADAHVASSTASVIPSSAPQANDGDGDDDEDGEILSGDDDAMDQASDDGEISPGSPLPPRPRTSTTAAVSCDSPSKSARYAHQSDPRDRRHRRSRSRSRSRSRTRWYRSRSRSRSRDRHDSRDHRQYRRSSRSRSRSRSRDRRPTRAHENHGLPPRPSGSRGAAPVNSKHPLTANAPPTTNAMDTDDLAPLDLPDDIDPFEDPDERERRLIEDRRKRRHALLQQVAVTPAAAVAAAAPVPGPEALVGGADSPASSSLPGTAAGRVVNGEDSDDDDDDDDAESMFTPAEAAAAGERVQAHRTQAEMDMLRAKDHGELARVAGEAQAEAATDVVEVGVQEDEEEAQESGDDGDDDDDDDDMFAVSTKPKKRKPMSTTATTATNPTKKQQHADEYADAEGYFRIVIGDTLNGKYRLVSTLGKGVFSVVAKAVDLGDEKREVAVKMVRKNDTMYKAGLKEVALLRRLNERDPHDKKHLVRMWETFEFRGHLCMVFESLSMNLRDTLKKYGSGVGLNLHAVRLYAHQLLLALSHLRKCNVIHADLKPDNILVNEAKTHIKLCDLGSASDASENDITPYLVSRFYRAPEVILGLPYDFAIDMWSLACTLFELATGAILFPGRTNNHMLKLIMDAKGGLPHKLIRRSMFGARYFDTRWAFTAVEPDRVTGKEVTRQVQYKPGAGGAARGKGIRERMMVGVVDKDEGKRMAQLADLVERMTHLNPEKRVGPTEALRHGFITGDSV